MWEIQFKIKNNEEIIRVYQVPTTKESLARKYAKRLLFENEDYILLSIKPC